VAYGGEQMEDSVDEEAWPAGTPTELVAYARELAISPDQVGHWVIFLTEHPHGQLAWAEIRRLWKPPRRRSSRAMAKKPVRRR
jgi:hypothetical protein